MARWERCKGHLGPAATAEVRIHLSHIHNNIMFDVMTAPPRVQSLTRALAQSVGAFRL